MQLGGRLKTFSYHTVFIDDSNMTRITTVPRYFEPSNGEPVLNSHHARKPGKLFIMPILRLSLDSR